MIILLKNFRFWPSVFEVRSTAWRQSWSLETSLRILHFITTKVLSVIKFTLEYFVKITKEVFFRFRTFYVVIWFLYTFGCVFPLSILKIAGVHSFFIPTFQPIIGLFLLLDILMSKSKLISPGATCYLLSTPYEISSVSSIHRHNSSFFIDLLVPADTRSVHLRSLTHYFYFV